MARTTNSAGEMGQSLTMESQKVSRVLTTPITEQVHAYPERDLAAGKLMVAGISNNPRTAWGPISGTIMPLAIPARDR